MRTAFVSSVATFMLMLGLLSVTRAAPAAEQMDQSNAPEWAGGWTNVNPAGEGQAAMWQTFTPARSNLTAVEIDILTISPGRGDDVLTVEVARDGAVLASVERLVKEGLDGFMRFEFPEAVPVVPEQTYELKVHDTGKGQFGWKYGSNTYDRGSRHVFFQPRLGTDWFFRTYARVEPVVAKYSGGTGEPNDPYQIATAADLIALGETPEDYGKHFILTADIDLDPNLPGRRVFDRAVIAPDTDASDTHSVFLGPSFTGGLDARGHRISNLTIMGGGYLGLFGSLAGTASVSNLGLEAVQVSGTNNVGGLAGENYGRITASYSSGAVSGRTSAGVLVGRNGSLSTSTISFAGSITCCYSSGLVGGTAGIGGLVGENWASIATSYSSSIVGQGEGSRGGLVGLNGERGRITACSWDTQSSGQIASDGGVGKTTAEMQTANAFLEAGWDFVGETANGTENVWWIFDGRDYPRLWWERVLGDDLEDGKPEPLWFVYEPEPELAHIQEANGRLEAHTAGAGDDVDAMYVADGWRLDATKDFAIRVDFHFGKQGPGDGRVTFGVGPSLDPEARQWAEFEAGCFDAGPFYLYEVSDGFWVREVVADRSAEEGTLFMSYNSGVDELYFSQSGYGKANAWQTVSGLLAGRWGGAPVYVLLGIGSEGMTLTGADAWLDDFAVNAGTLVTGEPIGQSLLSGLSGGTAVPWRTACRP